FLWLCVRRSKCLPDGGRFNTVDVAPFGPKLAAAVEFAGSAGELHRDDAARELWHGVYQALSEGKAGLLGAVTSRAEAQTMRLASIYTLLDSSPTIEVKHLQAGLAVWQYSESSARYIFGDALGDPVADEVLAAIRSRPEGMTRSEIRDHFG